MSYIRTLFGKFAGSYQLVGGVMARTFSMNNTGMITRVCAIIYRTDWSAIYRTDWSAIFSQRLSMCTLR